MSVIKFKGKIKFNPTDKTAKHKLQSTWKVVAMVVFDGEICEYYSWFIKKRYTLVLNKPLRGAHITFINDKMSDISGSTDEERTKNWESLKQKWDGKKVEVVLDPDARTNGKHWWINIPEEDRAELQGIRDEVKLGRPKFGMHMSIGYANEKNIDHSLYLHDYIKANNNLKILT